MGVEFLEVEVTEDGAGQGGYTKVSGRCASSLGAWSLKQTL